MKIAALQYKYTPPENKLQRVSGPHYVIPTFQNPTGRTWSLERRKKLSELSSKYNIPVVEDNPYGELRFEEEHYPIEGKFGQGKTAYGLNRIKARLRETSESWIAGIFLVLNLVKLAGAALPFLILKWLQNLTANPSIRSIPTKKSGLST